MQPASDDRSPTSPEAPLPTERLATPAAVREAQPRTARAAETVFGGREAIRDVLHGRDAHRLVVVVGPCSIHDRDQAVEYATRLRPLLRETADALVVVMRTYFEKPRTSVGWKGYLSDPHLDGRDDVAAGISAARAVLQDIAALGVPCASEVLDPLTPQYLGDLLAWVAIGARTAESQPHRAMASGLPLPVGIKNGTDGSVDTALDAVMAANAAHRTLGIDDEGRAAIVSTAGNPDAHVVLRGGRHGPNFGRDPVAAAVSGGRARGVARPVLVDCSHDNSGKDHTRQAAVCGATLAQFRAGQGGIAGMLIESNLRAGRQQWNRDRPLARGVSITDACIGFDETERILRDAAATVRERKSARVRVCTRSEPEPGASDPGAAQPSAPESRSLRMRSAS